MMIKNKAYSFTPLKTEHRRKCLRFLTGFTLTELLIVIIVLTVFTIIAYPTFRKVVISSRDKEAKSMLRLIAQAEEMYRLKSGGFYIKCNNTAECNSNRRLNLNIISGSSAAWSYSVNNSAPPGATFCAQALPLGTSASNKKFHIKSGEDEPSMGTCP